MHQAYIQTGNANEFRVRGQRGNWWVEGTDNNQVWVDAEPGARFATKREAMDAARDWAEQRQGKVVE